MHADPFGEAIWNTEIIVEPLGKEMKKLVSKYANAVNRICPINEQPAPDH
jgi:hypothetical protein